MQKLNFYGECSIVNYFILQLISGRTEKGSQHLCKLRLLFFVLCSRLKFIQIGQ